MSVLMRSLSEDELRAIKDVLQTGVDQKVTYSYDAHQMADEAATISKRACLSALEMLAPHLSAIEEHSAYKR